MKFNRIRLSEAKAVAVCLAILFLAGCLANPDDDISIGEITIRNIPVKIPVKGKEHIEHDTYKVYLNASNSQDADKPPVAQGMAFLSDSMLKDDGTYTVTLTLRKPIINLKPSGDGTPNPYNPPGHIYDPALNPNDDDGPWSGTAYFFTVFISPQFKTEDGVNGIWVKANADGLNKGKKNCDWGIDFLDFRSNVLGEDFFNTRAQAIYDDIVGRDPDIQDSP